MDDFSKGNDNWYQKNSGWVVPAAAAAASLATQAGGQRKAKKQQDKQNLWNLEMWNKTNAYNSPQEQMRRYQEAGLNPNLIYGSGNASSGNASPAPEMAKISEVAYQPLETGKALETLQAFTDWDIKKAQTDNLQSQTTNNVQTAALNAVKTSNAMVEGDRSKFELQKAKNLEQLSYDAAAASLRKTIADTEQVVTQTGSNLRESVERIATSKLGRERTKILMQNDQFDGRVKALDAYLSDMGIRPTDPFYAKMISQLLDAAKNFLTPSEGKTKKWYEFW